MIPYYEGIEKLSTEEDLFNRYNTILTRLNQIKEKDNIPSGKTLYIILGDITDRGTVNDLFLFDTLIGEAKIEKKDILVVPGNHDTYSFSGTFGVLPSRRVFFMKKFFGDEINSYSPGFYDPSAFIKRFDVSLTSKKGKKGDLVLVVIETGISHEELGSLGEFKEKQKLIGILKKVEEEEEKKKRVIILMHHSWTDLKDGGDVDFVDILREYQGIIKMVVCGHQHGEMEYDYGVLEDTDIPVKIIDAFFKDYEGDLLESNLTIVM